MSFLVIYKNLADNHMKILSSEMTSPRQHKFNIKYLVLLSMLYQVKMPKVSEEPWTLPNIKGSYIYMYASTCIQYNCSSVNMIPRHPTNYRPLDLITETGSGWPYRKHLLIYAT